MDKATLVNLDITEGSEVVSVLEDKGIKLKAALWMVTPEYEDGRLVLSSDALRQTDPLKDYQKVSRILRERIKKALPPIMILKTSDPFIKTLRNLFGKTQSVEGLRLGGQMIGNRFVDSAYVYRIQ